MEASGQELLGTAMFTCTVRGALSPMPDEHTVSELLILCERHTGHAYPSRLGEELNESMVKRDSSVAILVPPSPIATTSGA
mmetsp:Transcript_3638/g.11229  ORF Transcript_3638/g.11229 Transcript_3638/m.11229 type:complete len:81 (-) Transcript_3638:761-1003(-)